MLPGPPLPPPPKDAASRQAWAGRPGVGWGPGRDKPLPPSVTEVGWGREVRRGFEACARPVGSHSGAPRVCRAEGAASPGPPSSSPQLTRRPGGPWGERAALCVSSSSLCRAGMQESQIDSNRFTNLKKKLDNHLTC